MLPAKIHPTAIVDSTAKIGENVSIGPYSIIGKNVTIGDNTAIGPYCYIENTIMGKGNEVIASAFIGVKPQDLSYDGVESMVVIGDNNKIRECVTIHRSSFIDKPTTIGNSCLLMANAHVAHDCQLADKIIMVNNSAIAGHVTIEKGAILSGMVAAHQFVRIGEYAMISGLSGIPLDIPPYCRAVGGRAKLVGLNTVGLRRAGFTRDTIKNIKDAYKQLFLSTDIMHDSIEKIKASNPCPEVLHLVTFCENTKRGITAARMKSSKHSDDE
jgi:acyl-[acyl-carrier-protein]--UDP-N-acetylglucosamine O-acyltransferase